MGVKKISGYMTIVLSLILTLLVSFCLNLIEGVRYNGICLEAECTADAAWNSIFAEYHKELANRYNLYALDASYGTSMGSSANIERHLSGYLDRNLPGKTLWNQFRYRDFTGLKVESVSVEGGLLLTDDNGAVFRRQAIEALADDWNLTLYENVLNWVFLLQQNQLEGQYIAKRKEEADKEFARVLAESEVVESFSNPTLFLEEIRRQGILAWVLPEEYVISNRVLRQEGLYMQRSQRGQIDCGNSSWEPDEENLLHRFLFQEYLLHYMGSLRSPMDNTALQYELEYLLVGKESDRENLSGTLYRMSAIREAANALYLYSDREKSGAVEFVSTMLTSLIGAPVLAKPLKAVLILGWAYGESIYDMKLLVKGEPVPLLKNQDTWHYSLESLIKGIFSEEDGGEEGLYYEDYMRVLFMLTNLEQLTGRSMNLIEGNLRLTPGNRDFCLDHCYVELDASICMGSTYGYEYELKRHGTYWE